LAGLAAPLLLWQLPWRLGASSTALRPIDHIAGIGCPVFVIGGADDRYTPAGETRQMFAAAADPKELWLIAGVDHVDFLQAAGDEYRQRILSFLVRTLN
jgi:pimeloyl-ACP methyl ester carboxylesterase